MERIQFQLLEALTEVRTILREAEASTQAAAQPFAFSLDDSDGWPVLRLQIRNSPKVDSPHLKVTANDKGQLVVRFSARGAAEYVDPQVEGTPAKLTELITTALADMLDSIESAPKKEPFSPTTDTASGLFDDDDRTEDASSLPDIKL